MALGKSELFSNVDAAWLRMETPTNMAMITGVMTFDRPLDFDRLRLTLAYRFLAFPRFLQRVREPGLRLGLPRWELDPDFDFDYHLQRMRLPDPGDQDCLQEAVSELMSTPLDFSRPLWQFHYLENYGSGSAIIARIHHCIADGLALIQVLLSMTDSDPNAPWPKPVALPERKLRPLTRVFVPALKAASQVKRTWQTAENLVNEGMQTLFHPTRVLDVARLSTRSTKALGKLLLIGPDQKTIFKGKCGVPKRAAWSQPISLDEVKTVGRLMGGTVNDILLATVTGALRRYLEHREQPVEGVNIRAVVPVNLRPPDEQGKLGNRFGLVFLSLPVGVVDPIKRLIVLKRRMDAIKNSPEAVVAFGILNAIGMTTKQIESIIVRIFGMKGTAVMTNVPGPRHPIYLAGERMSNLMFWVPQPGNLGMGVSIISYNGGVILGIATDECLVPDPEKIIDYFHDEFEALKSWGRPPESEPEPEAEAESADRTSLGSLEATELAHSVPGNGARPDNRCQAFTRSGQRCKNRALPGQPTCQVHTASQPEPVGG